jgi:hypothetical protein
MKRIEVSSLGFTLTRSVPETNEEYNALAPKRDNPVLEDATSNILYRSTFATFRSSFLNAVEKDSGVKRRNSGTEKDPVWESDGKYLKFLLVQLNFTDDEFVAKYQALAQEQMDAAPFNPAQRESNSDGPAVGKNDQKIAAEVMTRDADTIAKVTAALGAKLNRVVDATAESIARAYADFRRAQAKEQELANKVALGL